MLEKGKKEIEIRNGKETVINLLFFFGPTLRRSLAVAHEEGKTTINRNLPTKKEQTKESEVG